MESSTEINVECNTVGANEGKKLFGDSTVTCYGDTYFLYDELPKCIAPGKKSMEKFYTKVFTFYVLCTWFMLYGSCFMFYVLKQF